jgi:membrane associated rhomboid family serine protease
MTEPQPDLLETILRQCAASAPRPWYPRAFVDSSGVGRDALDAALERLRLRGLIQLTEWVAGHGQGYELTPDGERVLHHAGLLAQVRAGKVPAARERPEELPRRPERSATPYERGEAIRDGLLSSTPPRMTFALIGLNVAVFAVGLALASQRGVLNQFLTAGDPHILELTGSVSFSDLQRGQWWRLLSNCFVHIGALHLGVNMYALYNIGQLMERILGRWRYLLLYLVAGFGGSCVGVVGQFACAGASGAICGLLGALAAWTFLNRQFLPQGVLASIQRYLVINSFLIVVVSLMPHISWSCHLGGAVFGLIAAALLNVQRFGSRLPRTLALLAVLGLPVAGVAGVLYAERADPRLRSVGEALEIREFNDNPLSRYNELRVSAWRPYLADSAPLLQQHPKRRDPAAVEKALATIEESRRKLNEAAELMRRAGPYTSRSVLEAQEASAEYATESSKYMDLAERCLRAGDNWTEKDDQQMEDQDKRVADASRRWEEALNPGKASRHRPG